MKTKLIGVLSVLIGIFLFAGLASASDTETLQPAATVTYNEDVDVNGTLYANSAYIGEEGVGGVTFFNGSIVNVGATTPVTIADDLRVDGEIYRTQKGGDPIKISDNVIPTLSNINNLGDFSHRWNGIYGRSGNYKYLYTDNLAVNEFLSVENGVSKFQEVHTNLIRNHYWDEAASDIWVNTGGATFAIGDDTRFRLLSQPKSGLSCNNNSRGEIIFNSTDQEFYGCTGTGWEKLSN